MRWVLLLLVLGVEVSGDAQVYRRRLSTTTPISTPSDGNPAIGITGPTQTGALSTSVTPETVTGTAADDVAATVTCVNDRGGACTVSNGGPAASVSWSASVALSSGVNVVTFTATDGSAPDATVIYTITYTAPGGDSTAPETTITAPADMSETGASTITVSGTCSDNVACDHTEYRVNGGAWATASGSPTSWTKSNVAISMGPNTIEARAYDSAGNVDASPASITVTRVTDAGAPTVTITQICSSGACNDGSTALATSAQDVDITGTCVDDVDATCARVKIFRSDMSAYVTYAGSGAPNANITGSGFVLQDRKPALGTVTYCARGYDSTQVNYGEDCFDVTYTRAAIMVTSWAPNARTSTAYSYDFYADGDTTGAFVWDNGNVGVTTFADADCAGLSISSVVVGVHTVGRISGTPTGEDVTCTLTMRAVGAATTTSTASVNITVQTAALDGAHDYFTAMQAHASHYKSLSMRDTVTLASQGGLTDQSKYTITSAYAQHNLSATHWTANDSEGEQIRLDFGDTITSGTFLYIDDMMWGHDARVAGCRGGGLNQFQAGLIHKQVQITLEGATISVPPANPPNPTNESIWIERNTDYVLNAQEDCTRIGSHSERWYSGAVTGTASGAQGNPDVYSCTGGGLTTITQNTLSLKPETWYRFFLEVKLNQPHTAFTAWNTCRGVTLAAGTYNMITGWVWCECDAAPKLRFFEYPMSQFSHPGVGAYNTVSPNNSFWPAEDNTSVNQGVVSGPVSIRHRNAVVLRDYALDHTYTNETAVITRPTR